MGGEETFRFFLINPVEGVIQVARCKNTEQGSGYCVTFPCTPVSLLEWETAPAGPLLQAAKSLEPALVAIT